MLIAHELGHYLGLSHLSVSGNLLHPSSGTDEVLDHGWMFVD
jgi:predicted Zn-dependent protease